MGEICVDFAICVKLVSKVATDHSTQLHKLECIYNLISRGFSKFTGFVLARHWSLIK